MIYYDSHNLHNFLKYVSPKNTQHLLIVHMTLGLRESFLVLFSENKWQKITGFWDFFMFPDLYFFTQHIVVNFQEFSAVRQLLLNSFWLRVDFWDDKIFLRD